MTEADPLMQSLFADVKRLMAVKGGMAQLARDIKVSRQAVSKWFAGETAPSGEVTLRLQKWVKAKEAEQQTKSPGSASTPPERKTRHRKSSHEKPKSSQEKR